MFYINTNEKQATSELKIAEVPKVSAKEKVEEMYRVVPSDMVNYMIKNLHEDDPEETVETVYQIVGKWNKYNCTDAVSILQRDGYGYMAIWDVLDNYCDRQDKLANKKKLVVLKDSKGNIIKTPFSIGKLADYLHDKGITIKYNVITNQYTSEGFNPKYSQENIDTNLAALVLSSLDEDGYFIGVKKEKVSDYLSIISMQNSFNPVKNILDNTKWDGNDYLSELYQIIGINESDELSKILVRKWLHQCLSLALYNDNVKPFGADGCLTLQGKQGIGKTRLLAVLGMGIYGLYKEGQSITQDKDTKRRCLTTWLCELGEIEKTFSKTSVEDLKQFITESFDEYRVPYAAKDTRHPRRASMYATCNNSEFLIDTTGNRRFWVIPNVNHIDTDKLNEWAKNNTAAQLWKQIFDQFVADDIEHIGFRLTPEEQNKLAERNNNHTKLIRGEQEILDYITSAELHPEKYDYKFITASDLQLYCTSLKKYSAVQIGKVLNKMSNIESKKIGNSSAVYNLPVWKF